MRRKMGNAPEFDPARNLDVETRFRVYLRAEKRKTFSLVSGGANVPSLPCVKDAEMQHKVLTIQNDLQLDWWMGSNLLRPPQFYSKRAAFLRDWLKFTRSPLALVPVCQVGQPKPPYDCYCQHSVF